MPAVSAAPPRTARDRCVPARPLSRWSCASRKSARSSGSAPIADDPLQPSIVPWSLAVTVGFYALGCAYARSRRDGSRRARFVDQASLAFFGVYLVHPLFLNVLLGRWLSWGATPVPPAAASALAWILLAMVALFTAFSFLTSKYWVHYDD